MTNKIRQEIIDYLESGDRFANILVKELDKGNLETYEQRTYSSLLDALNGTTELYCAMTEWPDNIRFIMDSNKNAEQEDEAIVIQHGLRTLESVQAVSDYLKDLPLSAEQNEKIVELMKDMLLVAEHETFMQGFVCCMKAIQDGGFKGMEDKIVKVADLEGGNVFVSKN